jgi:hypothetical protein
MEHHIVYFRSDQYSDYASFLHEFREKKYQPQNFIENDWWEQKLPLSGYLLHAYLPEEISARCIITPRQLSYQSKIFNCYEIGGTITYHPYQRLGLFTRLVTKATELGFESNASLIYGTPNDRSGPGYRKLNYTFIDQEDSFFVMMATSLKPIFRKIGLYKKLINNIDYPDEYFSSMRDMNACKVSAEKYIETTKDFPRMNYSSTGYLRRRFNVDITTRSTRRFFIGIRENDKFACALDLYSLSFMNLLLVSEYYLNGRIDHSSKKFSFLRMIASDFYKNYDGIYLKTYIPKMSRIYSIKHLLLPHRKLPICYFVNPDMPKELTDQMMNDLVKIFQLTDCDIG